jgi:hypothetical protein
MQVNTAHSDGNRSDGDRADRRSVDLDDPEELRYWAQRFHATEDDVRDAVSQAGTDPGAVGDFLQSGRAPHRDPGTHTPPRLRDEDLRRGGR